MITLNCHEAVSRSCAPLSSRQRLPCPPSPHAIVTILSLCVRCCCAAGEMAQRPCPAASVQPTASAGALQRSFTTGVQVHPAAGPPLQPARLKPASCALHVCCATAHVACYAGRNGARSRHKYYCDRRRRAQLATTSYCTSIVDLHSVCAGPALFARGRTAERATVPGRLNGAQRAKALQTCRLNCLAMCVVAAHVGNRPCLLLQPGRSSL